ncbi:MAG: hypothetical protein Q9190_004559 [Brigantiaea leucoxantha]
MGGKDGQASPESSDDDDDTVSLTSTILSEQQDEYVIEKVVAETTEDGVAHYLVNWEGYPDYRNTWEPAENFHQSQETLSDWKKAKRRIDQGYEKPFDIESWERKVHSIEQAKIKRQERRKVKRLLHGLPASKGSTHSSTSSEEASGDSDSKTPVDDNRTNEHRPPWRFEEESLLRQHLVQHKTPNFDELLRQHGPGGTTDDILRLRNVRELKQKAVELREQFEASGRSFSTYKEASSRSLPNEAKTIKLPRETPLGLVGNNQEVEEISSSDEPLIRKRSATKRPLHKPKPESETSKESRRPSKASDAPNVPQTPVQGDNRSQILVSTKTVPENRPIKTPSTNIENPIPLAKAPSSESLRLGRGQVGTHGRGPARLGPLTTGAGGNGKVSVFANWDAQPKSRKTRLMLPAGSNGNVTKPTKFKKFSTQNSVQKAARNEPAPNPESLVFINLKDGKLAPAPKIRTTSTSIDKGPFHLIQEQLTKSPSNSVALRESVFGADNDTIDDDAVAEVATANTAPSGRTTQPLRRSSISFEAYIRRNDSVTRPSNTSTKSIGNEQMQESGSPESTSRRAGFSDTFEKPDEVSGIVKSKPKSPKPSSRRRSDATIEAPQQRRHEQATINHYEPCKITSKIPPIASAHDPHQLGSYKLYQMNFSAQNYNANRHRDDLEVIGDLFVGLESEYIGHVSLRGLRQRHAKRTLLTIKEPPKKVHFKCQTMCTAGEFEVTFHDHSKYIDSGWIFPYKQTKSLLDKFAETLSQHASCALCFTKNFTLAIYPANSPSWSWLDNVFRPVTPDAVLRFALLEQWPTHPQVSTESSTEDARAMIVSTQNNVSSVFKAHFGIEFSRLVTYTRDQNEAEQHQAHQFFLIFPPSAQSELEFLTEFLRANGPVNIYKHDEKGAWDYFKNKVDIGVIICHESFYDYWAIPQLAWVLRKTINMFNFSLKPMNPLAPDPHLIRLFPHGTSILLTDSMFMLRTLDTARILTWFRLSMPANKSSWKICTRPAIQEWLLRIQEKFDFPLAEDFVACYTEVWRLLPPEMTEEWDPEVPAEDAPIDCMGDGVANFDWELGTSASNPEQVDYKKMLENDITLGKWFAGWGMTKQEVCRRFHIICGWKDGSEELKALKEAMREFGHVEIVAFEVLVEIQRVWEWERLRRHDERRLEEERKREAREMEEEEELRESEEEGGDEGGGDGGGEEVQAGGGENVQMVNVT